MLDSILPLLAVLLAGNEPLPAGIESRRQLEIEAALLAGDRESLDRARREVEHLFPRALERVYEARALQGGGDAQAWIEPLLARPWGGVASATLRSLAGLASSRGAADQRETLLRVREALAAIEGECDPALRVETHGALAAAYRRAGLTALALEHELAGIAALVDGQPVRVVAEGLRRLQPEVAEETHPLAHAELCLLYTSPSPRD